MALALATPIKAGKVEEWKEFMRDLTGARREGFRELNERLGLARHEAWLQANPDGSHLSIVFMEGPGEAEFDAKVATSDHPFDIWFRERLAAVHPIDPSEPPSDPPERWLPRE